MSQDSYIDGNAISIRMYDNYSRSIYQISCSRKSDTSTEGTKQVTVVEIMYLFLDNLGQLPLTFFELLLTTSQGFTMYVQTCCMHSVCMLMMR